MKKAFPLLKKEMHMNSLPAKRRGASLSRAIKGGSKSTMLSFSVTIP